MATETRAEPALVPSDLDAERGVLGSALVDHEIFGRVVQLLRPEDFYQPAHRHIFTAMLALFDRDQPLDPLLVKAELEKRGELEKVGGVDYLLSLAESVPHAASAEYYADLVKEKAVLRRLVAAGEELIRRARAGSASYRELLDEVEQRILSLGQELVTGEIRRMDQLLEEAFERLEALQDRRGRITGLATGFHELDELINGLQPAQLVVVAGRPSMGKTTFSLNVAEHVAIQEKVPVLIFTLEMSAEHLVENMLCSRAGVNPHKLKRGLLGEKAWTRLGEVAGELGSAPLFIDATPALTALDIRAKARRLKQREGLGLIVVDYLQLLEAGGGRVRPENRQQEIALISRSLKTLAQELKVPVIAISQLNRAVEQRKGEDYRPRMSDLRESGGIEQDADVILLLYRDEYYHPDREEVRGRAEVIVAKQRSGPTGKVELSFTGEMPRFRNLAR